MEDFNKAGVIFGSVLVISFWLHYGIGAGVLVAMFVLFVLGIKRKFFKPEPKKKDS